MADNIRVKTKHGELSLEDIASLAPGMSELMVAIGQRFQRMYQAAREGNLSLARYQARAVRKAFETSKVTRPKYAQAVDEYVERFISPIETAIQTKSWESFARATAAATEASDRYHKEWGYDYIRYRVSENGEGYRLLPPNG